MWKLWLVLAGMCFIIESFTVGFFVFWFGVGALLALIVSLFCSSFIAQTTIFIITSALLLVLTKPLIRKFVKAPKNTPTNVQRLIGKEGIVLEDIDTINSNGKIKVQGEIWSAISDSDIAKDSKVKIVSINGVKLKVEILK